MRRRSRRRDNGREVRRATLDVILVLIAGILIKVTLLFMQLLHAPTLLRIAAPIQIVLILIFVLPKALFLILEHHFLLLVCCRLHSSHSGTATVTDTDSGRSIRIGVCSRLMQSCLRFGCRLRGCVARGRGLSGGRIDEAPAGDEAEEVVALVGDTEVADAQTAEQHLQPLGGG